MTRRDPFDPLDGPVAATLDLHGFRPDEASQAVHRFLQASAGRYPGQLVHVITGRGRRSPGGPVLRPMVRGLLRQATSIGAWGLDLDEGGFLIRLR